MDRLLANPDDEKAYLLRRVARLERSVNHKVNNFRFHERRLAKLREAIIECLKCGVCFGRYGTGESNPRIFRCGHTFCETCVFRLLETQRRPVRLMHGLSLNANPHVAIRCPLCNHEFDIQENDTEMDLPRHRPLMVVAENFEDSPFLDDVDIPIWHREVLLRGDEDMEQLETIVIELEQNLSATDEAKNSALYLYNALDENSKPIRICPRCQNLYEQPPRRLKCGHIFCTTCNAYYFERFNENQTAYARCQTCRSLHYYYQGETRGTATYTFIDASQLE